MCIDHTAALSYVGSTVTVALFSQLESCVISDFHSGVNEIALFWEFTVRRSTDVSVQPVGPVFEDQAVHLGPKRAQISV
jgi:hypothetical protein